MDTKTNAAKRAEYWKAEHTAANVEIERLRALLRECLDSDDGDWHLGTGLADRIREAVAPDTEPTGVCYDCGDPAFIRLDSLVLCYPCAYSRANL